MISPFLNHLTSLGWTFSHLINLRPGWQVNILDDIHVIVASGETIEEAFVSALHKIDNGEYIGQLFSIGRLMSPEIRMEGNSLLAKLGLLKKEQPLIRRRV